MQLANTMGTQHKWSKRKVVMIPKAWDCVIAIDIPMSLGVTPSPDMVCKEEAQTSGRRKEVPKVEKGWVRVTTGWKVSQKGARHFRQEGNSGGK